MTDDDALDRRSVLRMTGGTVAASALAVGSVSGAPEECTPPSEPVELTTVTRTENSGPTTANGDELPVVAGGGLLITFPTEPFSVPTDTDEFSADEPSGCYEYRIDVEMTWNPTDSGPTNAGLFLYEGQGLEKCIASPGRRHLRRRGRRRQPGEQRLHGRPEHVHDGRTGTHRRRGLRGDGHGVDRVRRVGYTTTEGSVL
ncbi:hypothetical protein BRC88_03225 [Halobacteriales archaeon QS_4_69_225]|nr:MAG: hypothetical protein BRC88_03225 [Halobacteriales archaeon QS_4_69_225]